MRTRIAPRSLAIALAPVSFLLGCGGSDGGTPPDDGTDIDRVEVSPTTATVDIGASQQFTAEVRQKNGELSSTAPTWSATPQGIVSVSTSGLVTGVAEGSAVVRASAGGRSGEATVTITDPNPPAAPSAVEAEVLSHEVVQVSWTDNAQNEDEYRVEREPVTGGSAARAPQAVFSTVATLPAGTTSYRDEGLAPGAQYRYRVRACNDNGCVPEGDGGGTTTEAVTTHEVLAITTIALPAGVVDTDYSFTLVSSGGGPTHAWSLAAGTLPDGMQFAATGLLDGAPTVDGTFALTLQVASGEQTATIEADLVVSDQILAPQVVTEDLPAAAVGVPYAALLEAMHGDGSYTWALTSGQLPAGLVLDGVTGAIGGTPTTEGAAGFTVEVASAEMTGDRELSLVVYPALVATTSEVATGIVGVAYDATLAAEGGDGAYTWSLAAGTLPDGLMLDAGTGAITGTPTAAGTSDVTVQVESGDGQVADVELAVTIYPVLAVTTTELPDGQIGVAYEQALAAEGGDGSYTWEITEGALPEGVELAAGTGSVEGTPAESGDFDVTVRATSGDGQTAETELSLSIVPGPAAILTVSLPDAEVGVAYDETLAAVGGDGSYAWAVITGALPDGLTLDEDTGAVTGTPTTEETADFTVEVTSAGDTDTQALSITVTAPASPLAISTTALPDARDDLAYSTSVEASGGTPPYTWSLESGSLPDGVLLGAATGELAGTPSSEGSASFTLEVTDNLGATATLAFTLTVCPAVLDLGVGEVASVTLPDGCGAVLPAVNGDFRVALIPRATAAGAAYMADGLKLVGTAGIPGVEFPAPSAAAPYPLNRAAPFDPGLPDEIVELAARTEALHIELREAERRAVSNVPGAPPNRVGPPLPATAPGAGPSAVAPANRTFWVTPGSGERVEIGATLLGENSDVWYYADDDVIGTSNEPSQAEVDDLLAYYATYGKPIIDDAFGGLGPSGTTQNFKDDLGTVLTLPMGDLDENGAVIVLQVRPSYMLNGAAAYVSSCDRFPKSLENHNGGPFYCTGSNQAEITYYNNPDSDFYLGTLVHEVKHIASHGYAVFGDRGYNPTWIEEGTAEIAKEKSSRDAAGTPDGVRVGLFDVYNGGGGAVTPETYGMAVVLSRARAFLGAAPRHSLYGTPAPNPGNSTFYGASWLFHRFLTDEFGAGNEDAFMHALNTGGSGVARIEAVTGSSLGTLWERFAQAIAVEGKPAALGPSSNRFSSYDFDEIADGFSQEWPYVLTTSGFTTGSTTLPDVVFGGPNFFDFTGTGSTSLRLDVVDENDMPLSAAADVVMVIIRIR